MPAPYRRACLSCARSKRRCDLAVPRCYRCRVRSLECQYHHTAPVDGNSEPAVGTQQETLNASVDFHFGTQPEANDTTLSAEHVPTNTSVPPFPDYDLDWPDIMENIQDYSVPDRIGANDSPTKSVLAGEIYQDRVIYAVKWLKCLPKLFVTRGQTAFIHKSLYSMNPPRAIQDALGACALYLQKNEENQRLVYRNLGQQAERVVENYTNSSPLEQLASVQAMTLLQIIRYFDGNIRQRADAERIEPLYLEWIRQLQHRLGDSSSRDNELNVSHTTDSWQSWLVSESLRRTIIMGYTLQGFYCFLKNGWDDSHHEFNSLSFYAQKALWASKSEYQWQSALEKHPALLLRFNQWHADIAHADPMDLDDLGMVMMALIDGVDYCARWAGTNFIEDFDV